jgi:ATP-dependent Lon protease
MKNKKNDLLGIKPDEEDIKINNLIRDRITHVRDIIRDTMISVQSYKRANIFSSSEVNVCISSVKELYEKTTEAYSKIGINTTEVTIELLQSIIDKLSVIISSFGTKNVDDLVHMTFGSSFLEFDGEPELKSKFELIRRYIHPVGFKIISNTLPSAIIKNTGLCMNKISDTRVNIENAPQFECFECDLNTTSFYYKVHGIRVLLRCNKTNKILILSGVIDDVNLELFANTYINKRKHDIMSMKHACDLSILTRQVEIMTLKDILIHSDNDMVKKNQGILFLANTTKTDKLEKIIKHFTSIDILAQRNTLIDMLTCVEDQEMKYITYLLYDLITNVANDGSDSSEQMLIYDSFPWNIKILFKDAMKHTMKFTHQMSQKYDVSRISLEQQVYVMRAPESVKEKAMIKLKEIKGKSEDSNGKAKQYLEGLLKIPFGICREEPILRMVKTINTDFKKLVDITRPNIEIPSKNRYTNAEINMYIKKIESLAVTIISDMNTILSKISKAQIGCVIKYINDKSPDKIKWYKLKNRTEQIEEIYRFVKSTSLSNATEIYQIINPDAKIFTWSYEIERIRTKMNEFGSSMSNIDKVLDKSIHGHQYAKEQLKKVMCQWITGEQSGYSIGFEGPPGVGKTSLAKYGLAKCLVDENGVPRPFTFIALGGSSNGSTFEGHGYTYVNSMWGLIAATLMDAECENPIFYIDEMDKLSKTEHGNEITGILTHLIDTTQNSEIQDKYFSVPLNLSKALFIFSYNDPNLIDKILLDRIHRVKFEHLTIEEKITIARDYIIPDINKKMGMDNVVIASDELVRDLIIDYTMEPGVRKLKELLFDLYGAINMELLQNCNVDCSLPLELTSEIVENKYLMRYQKIKYHTIHKNPTIGLINGLYATTRGTGGVLPIEASFFPSTTFLEMKLTGLQGDVMKESMNVAKTLAWSLCSQEEKDTLIKRLEETKTQGVHLNCREGSVSKDGPSAGAAETIAILSIFTNKRIDNTIAMTGEIDLTGNISAIGGLDHKIIGGIRAGVKTFLYPLENHKDFVDFTKKTKVPSDISFIEVSNIQEIISRVFV